MHFKFTSDNGLETIAKKPSNLYLTLGENNMNNIEIRELAINLKLTCNWSSGNFKRHVTSMSWRLSQQYGHVTLVSGYTVLTAVN